MLVVTSPKGGVGVTTVAAELARRLAGLGRDVVAVNLTDQAALGYRLNGIAAIGGANENAMPFAGVAYRQVDETISSGKPRADFALAHRCEDASEDAVVVVDVAAGDRETRNALMASADLVLCVLAADAGSLAVLPQATGFQGVTPYCILNLVDERRAFAPDAVTLFGATFGPKLLGAIHQDEAVNEALALLAEIAPGSAADSDFSELALRIHSLLAGENLSSGARDVA
jgi:cellulose biosynthesis protein BcsQ